MILLHNNDLDKTTELAVRGQMKFYVECNVITLGRQNPDNRCTIRNASIQESVGGRDLGIMVGPDLHLTRQCVAARSIASQILGFIVRSAKSRSGTVILKLDLALVRPHLGYVAQFWWLFYRMDINLLEPVQRRMTKMTDSVLSFPYQTRLMLLTLLKKMRIKKSPNGSIQMF